MYETPQDLPLPGSLPKQASHIRVFDSPFRRRSHGMGILKCRSFSLALEELWDPVDSGRDMTGQDEWLSS